MESWPLDHQGIPLALLSYVLLLLTPCSINAYSVSIFETFTFTSWVPQLTKAQVTYEL